MWFSKVWILHKYATLFLLYAVAPKSLCCSIGLIFVSVYWQPSHLGMSLKSLWIHVFFCFRYLWVHLLISLWSWDTKASPQFTLQFFKNTSDSALPFVLSNTWKTTVKMTNGATGTPQTLPKNSNKPTACVWLCLLWARRIFLLLLFFYGGLYISRNHWGCLPVVSIPTDISTLQIYYKSRFIFVMSCSCWTFLFIYCLFPTVHIISEDDSGEVLSFIFAGMVFFSSPFCCVSSIRS